MGGATNSYVNEAGGRPDASWCTLRALSGIALLPGIEAGQEIAYRLVERLWLV
jgi:hypothetical protein